MWQGHRLFQSRVGWRGEAPLVPPYKLRRLNEAMALAMSEPESPQARLGHTSRGIPCLKRNRGLIAPCSK